MDMVYEYDGPSGLVIVHDWFEKRAHDDITEAIMKLPEEERPRAEAERSHIYQEIINFYSQYGQMPKFVLVHRSSEQAPL